MRKQFNSNQIQLGEELKWDLFNSDGRRLFRKGFVFHAEQGLRRLERMQLFYDDTDEQEISTETSNVVTLATDTDRTQRQVHYQFSSQQEARDSLVKGEFFMFLDFCIYQAQLISEKIVSGERDQLDNLYDLIDNIELLYRRNEEACIGAVHLETGMHPYSSLHPVYAAILCLMMAKALRYSYEHRRSLVGAALTANLGMYEYHDDLVNNSGGLSDKEFARIKLHPSRSRDFLLANKLTDKLWHKIVIQSHERLDGSGYPKGLNAEQIINEAKIYSVIDTYLSMIMPRAYRAHRAPKIAMKDIYETAVAEQNVISIGLIKGLGVYPPGSRVLLKNDEIGIVTKRNPVRSTAPQVMSVCMSNGKAIRPILRDTSVKHLAIADAIDSPFVKGVDPKELWDMGEPIMANFKIPKD